MSSQSSVYCYCLFNIPLFSKVTYFPPCGSSKGVLLMSLYTLGAKVSNFQKCKGDCAKYTGETQAIKLKALKQFSNLTLTYLPKKVNNPEKRDTPLYISARHNTQHSPLPYQFTYPGTHTAFYNCNVVHFFLCPNEQKINAKVKFLMAIALFLPS